jgi:hypothetical protein
VLKCDFSVVIVQKGCPESRLSYSTVQIEALNCATGDAAR